MSKKHQYKISSKRGRAKANRSWRRKAHQRLFATTGSSEPRRKPKGQKLPYTHYRRKTVG